LPELPEVETVVRALRPVLGERRIQRLELLHPRVARHSDPAQLEEAAHGAAIGGLRRRGKYILLELEGGRPPIAVHLRMSGQLLLSSGPLASPHVRAVFHLARPEGRLNFVDVRTFGTLFLLDGSEPEGFRRLGVEPLSSDFTVERFAGLLASSSTEVKSFLLRQEKVAGIGNIYACEACHEAKVHPRLPARLLGRTRVQRLHAALQAVLGRAVEQMGTTLSDFRRPDGEPGNYGNQLLVYGREGEPCPRCRARIQRIVQHGRSTFFCPRCQHPPRRR
jgi:formamidopyrimidine-DNA glycosylase